MTQVIKLKEIYLDNSATTMVCPEACKKAVELMTIKYGNPSSLHSKGFEASRELEAARKAAAELLGADTGEIYFTSGGTESNNTAIYGAAGALARRGRKIVTTAFEHSSVIETAQDLESKGYEIVYLPPDTNGRISLEQLAEAVDKNTVLVSIMAVNNETGAIQPIESVRRIIDRSGSPALFHVDAVQAFGKLPLKPKKTGIDLLSASSHKIHGPKGAGILYVRKGVRILPLHHGGEQEKRLRPGTEAVPLICAMGEAIKALPDMKQELRFMETLNSRCREGLTKLGNVHINSGEDCLPYIINFSVEGIRSETMLHFLASKGIFVSSGSACARGKKSHVLEAMGLSPRLIDSAVRVSFSRYNTAEDVDELIKEIINADNTLARSK